MLPGPYTLECTQQALVSGSCSLLFCVEIQLQVAEESTAIDNTCNNTYQEYILHFMYKAQNAFRQLSFTLVVISIIAAERLLCCCVVVLLYCCVVVLLCCCVVVCLKKHKQ